LRVGTENVNIYNYVAGFWNTAHRLLCHSLVRSVRYARGVGGEAVEMLNY